MSSTMILVSGMPGTGKTSLAKWLSSQMRIPLVCYDHVKTKTLQLASAVLEEEEQERAIGPFTTGYLWFFCEEIMKSASPLIVEYFFTNKVKEETIDALVEKYKYRTVNVHMDTSSEVAYRRYQQRNLADPGVRGLRPDITFERFEQGTKANKDFRYGDHILHVDTTDFAKVSYEDILRRIGVLM